MISCSILTEPITNNLYKIGLLHFFNFLVKIKLVKRKMHNSYVNGSMNCHKVKIPPVQKIECYQYLGLRSWPLPIRILISLELTTLLSSNSMYQICLFLEFYINVEFTLFLHVAISLLSSTLAPFIWIAVEESIVNIQD